MRRAIVSLIYAGVNITKDIAPDFQGFSYKEVAEGSADSLQLTLQNKTLKWMGEWLPQPGDKISASITQYDWAGPGEVKTLDCGSMIVDSPTFSGPFDVINLNALNIPADQGFNDAPQDTTWADITMSQLGQMIASKYGMSFTYDAPTDFVIHALKRTKQTDAALLSDTCKKYNLCLKVYSDKLIIYSKAQYEQRDPIKTITYGSSNINSYTLASPIVGTGFTSVTINYKPTKTKTMLQYTFSIGTGGKSMILQESADDDEQAELIAKEKMREANEKAFTGTLNLALDLDFIAGCTFMLAGFGKFDGKYYVDTCDHDYGKGAGETNIAFHRCLEGGY
jgi:hypothetical protein